MGHQAEPDEPESEPEPEDAPIDPMMLVASAAEHVADQARRHPYRTLGIALGVGYVLGGGLPRFVVRMAGMAALRSVGHALLTSSAAIELARSVLADEPEAMRKPATPRDRGGRFTS
jgi:hypothetical protein